MACQNPIWGEERIANELLLKLGVQISPRTVRKYINVDHPRRSSNQRWNTFVLNHAHAIVACDFFISVTASFRLVYVFVAMEVGSRRILHCNVTEHPTAEWVIQQLREFLAFDHSYRFLIHDRDSILSAKVDSALNSFKIHVLKSPVRTPTANAFCERLIGTIRRDCLDYLIPLNQSHLLSILKEYITHFNRGRPHSALGPGIPEPSQVTVPASGHRHKLLIGFTVKSKRVAGPDSCRACPRETLPAAKQAA